MTQFNEPLKDPRDISEKEFNRMMFLYQFSAPELRQVFEPDRYDAMTFALKDRPELGIAIVRFNTRRKDHLGIIRFSRVYEYYCYGGVDAWHDFSLAFATQFAGDNS